MKPKMFNKKLFLNKKTIANLVNGEMNGVYGGAKCDTFTTTCNPCAFIESYCGGPATCATLTGNPQSNPCCNTC